MPDKKFLEEYSLFRKFRVKVPETVDKIPEVPINMQCKVCDSIQTFLPIKSNVGRMPSGFAVGISNHPSADQKLNIRYACQSCKGFSRQFDIYISPDLDYYYKFGQYPEWEIKMDRNLEKVLGEHSSTFRKGLVCESQGYGIGAFAYYRRITEEIIDELLEKITDLLQGEERDKYLHALKQTKETRVTQEKIDLVKDLLPAILRPEGMNPLGVLHKELSQGLHAETDEKCLERATHIKNILQFLVNQIIHSREVALNFTNSMKSLLDKRSKE